MKTPYLATLETDGWMVDDGEVAHHAHPDSFWIPNLENRATLQAGDWAKVRFYMNAEHDGQEEVFGERMWVEVLDSSSDFYRGKLINEPVSSDVIAYGDTVWFEPRHVIDIVLEADQESDEDE